MNLLHPTQPIPVQSWTFESESVVRIGRAKENEVVVHSAVVSRLHVELQRQTFGWEVISRGTNGTFVNGERITQTKVLDGMVIRLGTSGPKIQILIGSAPHDVKTKANAEKRPSPSSTGEAFKVPPTFLTRPQTAPPEENVTRRED
ncbi:FHA domain-containing protein [Leptolyngbya sp. 'hensonii']|uniref:FHA domain-containing protein n=1 Tax=Leptolyngbya sp. 'hensonii' TaxID=1922337 RepID=UPI00209AB423|nr:FHA domain-containing protein [Leptolyngbya sp. 'hensonii']